MDWLKAQGEVLKQAAQQHVSEMMEDVELVGDVLGKGLDKAAAAAAAAAGASLAQGSRDLEFGPGPVGFTLAGIDGVLEGLHVLKVEPGSQAERLGVVPGDRLCAISGYEVPAFELGNQEAEEKAAKVAKKWLRDMPRPGRLTFKVKALPKPAGAATSSSALDAALLEDLDVNGVNDEKWEVGDDSQDEEARPLDELPGGRDDVAPAVIAGEVDESVSITNPSEEVVEEVPHNEGGLRAELQWERDKRKQVQGQLQEAKQMRSQLASILREANANLKAAEERERALEEQVARLRKACAGVESASHAKEENSAQKVVTLEEKVSALRTELQQATVKADELEERAVAAEQKAESMAKELTGFREAHDAELELVMKGQRGQEMIHQVELQKMKEASEEKRRGLVEELQQAQEELKKLQAAAAAKEAIFEAARTEVEAAQVEAAAARAEAAKAREAAATATVKPSGDGDNVGGEATAAEPKSSSTDVAAMAKRIDYLEKRCKSLQAQPGSRSGRTDLEAGSLMKPSWEPWLQQVAGPKTAAMAVFVYSLADSSLKTFTARLLEHDAWLWIFYIHLVVLYTISGSCYAETASAVSSDPIESLNKELTAVGAERPPAPLRPP